MATNVHIIKFSLISLHCVSYLETEAKHLIICDIQRVKMYLIKNSMEGEVMYTVWGMFECLYSD